VIPSVFEYLSIFRADLLALYILGSSLEYFSNSAFLMRLNLIGQSIHTAYVYNRFGSSAMTVTD
jgi:hypothetical protein